MSVTAPEMPPGEGAWAPVPAWQISLDAWIRSPAGTPRHPVRVTSVNTPGNGWRTFGWDEPAAGSVSVRSGDDVDAWVPAGSADHTARIAA